MIVFYTDRFIPARFSGYTIFVVILIRPSYFYDRGLLEHEKVHVRQNIRPWKWFMGRLAKEVEAYKEQLKWYPDDKTHVFATFIATKYGLDITVEEAEKLLR